VKPGEIRPGSDHVEMAQDDRAAGPSELDVVVVGAVVVDPTIGVSAAALDGGLAGRLGTRRSLVPVTGCRGLDRGSLWANRSTAPIEVDPVDGTVSLGGRVLAVEPVTEVPLSRRYLLR